MCMNQLHIPFELYVPIGLIWRTSRNMEQNILFGNNSLGTYTVNKIYRIVIHQILQSLGIYYGIRLDYKRIFACASTIILDWGEVHNYKLIEKKGYKPV